MTEIPENAAAVVFTPEDVSVLLPKSFKGDEIADDYMVIAVTIGALCAIADDEFVALLKRKKDEVFDLYERGKEDG